MKKEMKKKTKLRELVFPNRRINFFVATILVLGVLSGAIFLMMSSDADRASVVSQIQSFFVSIEKGQMNKGLALRNSLIINYLFVGGIWLLGLSMIGIVVNIFITYIKGFLVGFSIASILFTYGYKGILASLLYTFPSQVLNIIVVLILSIYSIMFASHLGRMIISKKNIGGFFMLKKYFVILMFCVIVSFISSLLEVYVFPNILKLVISVYVS